MRHADIAIVGGGLAGSSVAAMLGRKGFSVVLIDPHPVYPPDFRSEKLAEDQVLVLRKTGLADAVFRAATAIDELWVSRFGRLVEKRRNHQYGILYDRLVNTIRAEVPPGGEFIAAKVSAVSTGSERQTVVLSNGERVCVRLVVLATGLNNGLRRMLGIARADVSAGHSISIGFDVDPVGRPGFDFPALTYYPERAIERISYLTLFPIGSTMRANLFVYRDPRDPWLSRLRATPQEALFAAMPGLQKLLGDFAVTGDIKIRPADLCATKGFRQAGIVLVGDAFATSCPAAGTGVGKVFTDVERLCNVHVARWLATPGMGEEKIAAYYDDPVKRACDSHSSAMAYYVRSIAVDPGLIWQARRWGKFVAHLGVGTVRRARLSVGAPGRQGAVAGPA